MIQMTVIALIFVDLTISVATQLNTLVRIHLTTLDNVLTIMVAILKEVMENMASATARPTASGIRHAVKSCL
jgi:hypothetical protein